MAQNDPFTDTTIDLGRLRAAAGAARRPALAVALAVGLAAAGLAALRPSPVALEERVLVEPAAASRKPADEDRVVADQIGLLRAEDFLRRTAAAARPAAGEGSDRAAVERAERDLAALQSDFTVARLDRSRILVLRLTTSDEAAGRRLLATLRDRWSAALADTRSRAEAEVGRRFAAEIDAAKQHLAAAESEAAVPAETAPVASDLDALRAERAGAEAVLQRLRDFAGEGTKGVEHAVDAAPTPGLQDLRRKRSLLRSRLAELSITYLANHPLMKQVSADFDDLRTEMRAELPRAVATAAARVAELDRRIAEQAAETTGSLPAATAVPDPLAAPRAALDAVLARRDAARRAAVERVGVSVRPLGAAEVEATVSPVSVAAVGFGGGVAAFLAALAGFAGRRLRRPAPPARGSAAAAPFFDGDVASAAPAPVVAPERVAPAEVAEAADPRPSALDTALRVDRAFAERRRSAARLAGEIRDELGADARVVVVSIGDPARASGAARALVAATAGETGLVDLAAALDAPGVAGLSELLDGGVTFSEAIRRDPALAAWTLGVGGRALGDADLVDPALAAALDACAVAWGGVVIAAGRLDAGEGQTALFVGADAVVLAESDGADPRVARVLDVFLDAGRPAWVLAPDATVEASAALAGEASWAAAA